MSSYFWLTDAQMARPEPFFRKSYDKPRFDDRRVLSGIIFINRNGITARNPAHPYHVGKAWDRTIQQSESDMISCCFLCITQSDLKTRQG